MNIFQKILLKIKLHVCKNNPQNDVDSGYFHRLKSADLLWLWPEIWKSSVYPVQP